MKSVFHWVSRLEDAALTIVLWVLFVVVGLQFFTRYILNNSLGWTEEIARMILIVLCYTGAIVCARNRSHISVELLTLLLPASFRSSFRRVMDFVCMLLFGLLASTAGRFAMTTQQSMSSVDVPKSIIYWICALSLGLMAIHYLVHLLFPQAEPEQPPEPKGL
ncbi:TRAP transporter small permease [Pelagibius sp. Alg239-R121]|uniref:TRAP transporter small permease n=1 Tax=Pelagibius sp. Alg239-R121 TaxID=2993448 RepID=UPI0024A61CF3|nr:TRAP transporter small permease [Pelagibius sp. Alg239-R121]